MFTQILDPTGNLFVTWLVALIPVVLLLFLLAGLRMSAWLAVLIGSIVTFLQRRLGKDRRLSMQTSFSTLHEPAQPSSVWICISSPRQTPSRATRT